jgi:hypothetical protein
VSTNMFHHTSCNWFKNIRNIWSSGIQTAWMRGDYSMHSIDWPTYSGRTSRARIGRTVVCFRSWFCSRKSWDKYGTLP